MLCCLYQIFKVFPYFEIDHVSFNSYFESFWVFYSNELQYCFLFCSIIELFNFIVLEFSFFIKKIFSFVDNLNFFFYIITSRENYSLAWKWVSHDLAHMMYVDDLITQLVSYCHCGIMISTNCWTCLFINKYYLLHLLSMFYIKRN